MKQNIQVGQIGEKIAMEYLENKGYEVIQRNYKTRRAEIDIIAKKKNILVFVEVRTKTGEEFGTPEDTLTKAKLARVRKNAAAYIVIKNWQGLSRVDAICIVLNPDSTVKRIEHYENIC